MITRLRKHLNPPMVVAMIALFAALGGGYAMAFSGSGSLQKGGQVNILQGDYETVRTLTGIGSIEATCTSADVAIRFQNDSGEALELYTNIFSTGVGSTTVRHDVSAGGEHAFTTLPDSSSRLDIHVVPDDGSKAPQSTVQVSTEETASCTTARVTVLALNTQQ